MPCATPASTCSLRAARRGPVFHNVETPNGRVQTCIRTGVPLPRPGHARRRGGPRRAGRIVPVAGEIDRRAGRTSIPAGAYVARRRGRASCATCTPGERVTRRGTAAVGDPRAAPTSSGVSHHDVPRRDARRGRSTRLLHPGADLLDHREAAPAGCWSGRRPDGPGRDAALPADRDRPGARPDRRRRHVPRGAASRSALRPGHRRPASVAALRPTCGSRRRRVAGRRGHGLDGVPDRAAVIVRRARERIRRAVLAAGLAGRPVSSSRDDRPRVSDPRPTAGAAGRRGSGPPRGAAPGARCRRRRRSGLEPDRAAASSAPRRIAQAMLAELRELDRGHDGRRPGPAASARPRVDRAPRAARAGGAGSARSTAIRSVVHGAAKAVPDAAVPIARPARPSRRSPPWTVATTTVRSPRRCARDVGPTTPRSGRSGVGPVSAGPTTPASSGLERVVSSRALRRGGRAGRTPGRAGQVAGRRDAAPRRGRRSRVRGGTEQPRQRADVLVVVADDVDERLGRAAAQEAEVAARDLPAVDVAVAVQAEQPGLGRPQPGVGQPVAEQPPDDRQQVEVAGDGPAPRGAPSGSGSTSSGQSKPRPL